MPPRATNHPKCFIIAGPIGAGKTTFAMKFLPTLGCRDFINADEIAKGLSPLNFSAGLLAASKIFLSSIQSHIQARQDFSFETTLSGKAYLAQIPRWREDGWLITLIYLYVSSPKLSEDRVMERVMQGGHDIPKEDIYRRYPRSLANLFEYAKICDHVLCLDNSRYDATVIFEQTFGAPPTIKAKELYDEMLRKTNILCLDKPNLL